MGVGIWRIFEVAGGIGIFLYGMNIMSQSLEKAAGNRMKNIINICTKNRLLSVLAGTLVTAVIQSSSATTVMVVGFVNAGLMNLCQAAGVIVGANIGTTITAQLIAFNLDDIAPIVAGVGAIVYIVSKKEISKNIAHVFVGFGLLFTGIVFLKDSLSDIGNSTLVMDVLSRFDGLSIFSYIVLLLAGAAITVFVQSSSTVTGIMIAMASQNLLTINMAVPLILGANLGTTCTALLSAVGANLNAKRAAWIHVIFNISGILIFIVCFQGIALNMVESISPLDIPRQIANLHTIFNLFTAFIIMPFVDILVKGAVKLRPDHDMRS